MGLPPYAKNRPPVYSEDGETTPNNLRLHCHRLNSKVVILFSGGIKTRSKAQDCPNVKSHFLLANRLTNIIDRAIQERDIRWTDTDADIQYDNEMTLYY